MSQDFFDEKQKLGLRKSLLLAYRKAKADVFYQSTDRLKILKYEENLEHNLEELHDAIVFGRNADLFSSRSFTGSGTFAPKSLELGTDNANNPRSSSAENVVFTSPTDQWNEKTSWVESDGKPYTATFRLMSDSGMGLHVLSALWIMHVGAVIEKKLFFETPYANRIRRTRDKDYNNNSLGTFDRYLDGYRTWISDATEAMDRLVKQKKKVASFTTDAKEYFHSIPASILDSKDFKKEYLFRNKINDLGMRITECLSEALVNWEKNTAKKLKLNSEHSEFPRLGLPVGLSCSAFLGNVVLDSFDKAIVQEIKPAYYGRYVDDIAIILEWHEEFAGPLDVWQWIKQRVSGLHIQDEETSSDAMVSYQVFPTGENVQQESNEAKELSVTFKASKTKLLVADPSSGRRAIEALKHALKEKSSEWRLLTHTPDDASDIGPALITAMDEAGEPAVRGSQLKTLSSKRSELSIWLREFEQLERLCEATTWTEHRKEFYSVVQEQLLTPLNFMDFFAIVPRILALALNCGDLKEFQGLVSHIADAISKIEDKSKAKISPEQLTCQANIFSQWRIYLFKSICELVIATSPTSVSSKQKKFALQKITDVILKNTLSTGQASNLTRKGENSYFYRLFNHDLALIPFKEVLSPVEVSAVDFSHWDIRGGRVGETTTATKERTDQTFELSAAFPAILGAFKENFWKNILSHSSLVHKSPDQSFENRPLFDAIIFPTRPLSVQQAISWSDYLIPGKASLDEYRQQSDAAFAELDNWLRFLRGFSIQNAVSAANDADERNLILCSAGDPSTPSTIFGVNAGQHRNIEIRIPRENSVLDREPRIAVASLFTSSNQITRSIAGKTELGYESYRAFTKFIDQVVSPIPEASQPDYVLFPELIMPAPWFEWFGNHLASKYGIGLIAGITYLQGSAGNEVHNQIWASLPTSVVGFRTAAIYRQDKQQPAHGEEQSLRNFESGKILRPKVSWSEPPVIWHGDYSFALLICSELTNIAYRTSLRGKIDTLFVAEKNRDLNTFEALVDSAALDIHTYVAQSNSREFGDSRIRAPKKENHERDVARVRGGINDHFVVGKVEVKKLREFQTRHYHGADFKPLPDGFRADFDSKRSYFPSSRT